MSDALQQQLQSALGAAYSIERELGGGGMSRVFLARDEQLGRPVVVKVLAPDLAQSLSVERFTREVRLAAVLQEPHIVPVLSAGTADGLPYYTMPYVDGSNLRVRLHEGRVPAAESLAILHDVARALAYAHAHGVVHRDIKPENVLLSSGTAVVTDFGIAKAVQRSVSHAAGGAADQCSITQVGTLLGTPAYMAPEQAMGGQETDQRADIYSWGIVAYELLAGRHPFDDRTTLQALLVAHFGEEPAPLVAATVGVPQAVTTLVMRCLAKSPADRPASARELLAVLDGAGPVRAWPRLSRRARLGLAAVAAAGLVAAPIAWRSYASGAKSDVAGPLLLAVLPFDNAGPAEQAPFTDGLTDAVTAKLGALPGLAVIDRQSAAEYRQTRKSARQIGTELGVPYLLEGVVRWAKDAGGTWRAQVTPTLVDARAGTTRWTGDPVLVTPSDPFTAPAAIATTVAEALQLALRPADRATLARGPTQNPDAFAAYERGLEIFDAAGRGAASPYEVRRGAAEFARAVALDSSFGTAWGWLAGAHLTLARLSPGDSAAEARMRQILAQALAHAPGQPRLLLTLAVVRIAFDHDTAGVDTLLRHAIRGAPNDASVLSRAAAVLTRLRKQEEGYTLARRAATLDPRSAGTVNNAAAFAMALRHWPDASHYADALIALDSADERGWYTRVRIQDFLGDTVAMQREAALALAHLPHPTDLLLTDIAYAGNDYGRRYAALSAPELGVQTLYDSVYAYYDTKADVYTRIGDAARARVYYDSIRTVLAGRRLSGPTAGELLSCLALSQASLGRGADARRTLTRIRALSKRADLADAADAAVLAATYGRLAEPDSAVHWLEVALANPASGYTANGLAVFPKLIPLHGTPAFERFLRSHAQ